MNEEGFATVARLMNSRLRVSLTIKTSAKLCS